MKRRDGFFPGLIAGIIVFILIWVVISILAMNVPSMRLGIVSLLLTIFIPLAVESAVSALWES